jgi:hypothetical protein
LEMLEEGFGHGQRIVWKIILKSLSPNLKKNHPLAFVGTVYIMLLSNTLPYHNFNLIVFKITLRS